MLSTRGGVSEVIDNVRRIFHALNEYSKAAEQTTSLTAPQLWALKILASGAPIRLSELARQMFLRPATVVGIIDRLEVKGMVTRKRSMDDRRAVDLKLTDLGLEVVSNAPEVAQEILLQGFDSLTDEEFSCVEEGMKQVVRILGAEIIRPQPLHS